MYARERTELERLEDQLILRQYRVGPDAARTIAQRIEKGHGFWDYEERKLDQVSESPSEHPASTELMVVVKAGNKPRKEVPRRTRPGVPTGNRYKSADKRPA